MKIKLKDKLTIRWHENVRNTVCTQIFFRREREKNSRVMPRLTFLRFTNGHQLAIVCHCVERLCRLQLTCVNDYFSLKNY